MAMANTHLVVMGVSGCGKSTVGQALARQLGWTFADGDDFHSPENVAKMSAGVPLTDEDRWPWLDAIVAWTTGQDAAGRSTIVPCSALRRSYRDRLRTAPGRTLFVHLSGSAELLAQRLSSRSDHFMRATMLASQLATLEPLEPDEAGFVVDIDGVPQSIVEQVMAHLPSGQ
jgi:carbohydrate kinase (thermoresistant glucokinase family)